LKRELINDYQALLRFVWPFLPARFGEPPRTLQVRFSKFQREPRKRQDLKRLCFNRPELDVDVNATRGPEFQVLTEAALALANLANTTGASKDPKEAKDDIIIDVAEAKEAPRTEERRKTSKKRPAPVLMSL
jgi:hypothetical protein